MEEDFRGEIDLFKFFTVGKDMFIYNLIYQQHTNQNVVYKTKTTMFLP